jgi:PBP1b-binding outer membrane lipoprotein LpoB
MKVRTRYSVLLNMSLLFSLSCVTGNTKSEKAPNSAKSFQVTHMESMAKNAKTNLNQLMKNIGTCKYGTHFDSIENKTGQNLDMAKFQSILTKTLGETDLKIIPKSKCWLFGSLGSAVTKSGTNETVTYHLTLNIRKPEEIVWSHKQELKIKM